MPYDKEEYSRLLKDPRWQRKRLEILNRDNWTCLECGDKESTLHVHHLFYVAGSPWMTPDLFNRVLSLSEIKSWQFDPRNMDGCVDLKYFGFEGTGNAIDYSGNGNTGTVTGLVVAARPPLQSPFRRSQNKSLYAVAAGGSSAIAAIVSGYKQRGMM